MTSDMLSNTTYSQVSVVIHSILEDYL